MYQPGGCRASVEFIGAEKPATTPMATRLGRVAVCAALNYDARAGGAGTVENMRLLLIEDDDILGEGLRDFLRGEGHGVDWCRRLADAQACVGEAYDALLVDWQLPDGSG